MNNFQFNDLQKEVDVIGLQARACLNMAEFKQYRKQFEQFQRDCLDIMMREARMSLINGSPMDVFGARILRYLTKLEVANMMIAQVETEAARGDKKAEAQE